MGIFPTRHSAEHILTAVIGNLFQGKIIDSRFKGHKVRCDYLVNCNLTAEKIVAEAEKMTNKIIAEDREVTYEEMDIVQAKELCSLHRLPIDVNKIRIVRIGNDVITPCIGNHVKTTSEIGKLKIRTFAFIKPSILRLTFVVG